MSFIYLAAPYSHPNEAVRALRYAMINEYAARIMQHGISVFSPISQSHEIARYMAPEYVLDHEFWMSMDLPVLERAGLVVVLRLDGWDKSRGVVAETKHAREHGVPLCSALYDDEPPIDLFMGAMRR